MRLRKEKSRGIETKAKINCLEEINAVGKLRRMEKGDEIHC